MRPTLLAAVAALASFADAWAPPNYGGFNLVWQEAFGGGGGSSPNGGNWNIINGNLGVNNELQTYTSSTRNAQLSGGGTLQLVPWRDGAYPGGWSSGRMESKYVFTPQAGKLTRVEAAIRFGGNNPGNKQGIWPAFWMLGNSIRNGAPWPGCGEIDILETVNGQLTGHGTLHCDVFPGGICNEGLGIGSTVGIPNQDWHNWRVEVDRRPGNWQDQSITWYMDGQQFHQIRGSRINNFNVWASIAQSPLFIILNVAVGGNWVSFHSFLSYNRLFIKSSYTNINTLLAWIPQRCYS